MDEVEVLLKDCCEHRQDNSFRDCFTKFYSHPEVQKWMKTIPNARHIKGYDKQIFSIDDKITDSILSCLEKEDKCQSFFVFKYYVQQNITDKLRQEAKNNKRNESLEALTEGEDKNKKYLEDKSYTPEEKLIKKDSVTYGDELKTDRILEEIKPLKLYLKEQPDAKKFTHIIFHICYFDEAYKSLNNYSHLMEILKTDYKLENFLEDRKGIKEKKVTYEDFQKIRIVMNYCEKNKILTGYLPHFDLTFSIYSQVLQYCINLQQKKNNLIDDFVVIRAYLSSLFNDRQTDQKQRTEQEQRKRINDLYKLGKTKADKLKEYLLDKTANDFSKIYDIHKVPNLVFYFMLLDILEKYPSAKLSELNKDLWKYKEHNDNEEKAFLEKLKSKMQDLADFGFVTIKSHDRYSLNAKYLTDKQKEALTYVIPFFCGFYPFSGIGHFIANRIKISDIFKFDAFNIQNIIDDCETYDLLEAVNNQKEVTLKLYENDKEITFKPAKLYIDKNDYLIKTQDADNNRYSLNEIEEIKWTEKQNNPVFSEIYSFYYKIFEEIVQQYKKNQEEQKENYSDEDIKQDIDKILDKYPFYKDVMKKETITEILKSSFSQFDKIELPITMLERRYLKTIMQDERFDLFVPDKDTLFVDLVKDVEPFDLSKFMIWNGEEYQTINSFKVKDKKSFQQSFEQKLKNLNEELEFLIYSKKSDNFS